MSADALDDETMAALIDGRLEGEARTRALAVLARDPALYEAFVEASALAHDLAREVASAPEPAGARPAAVSDRPAGPPPPSLTRRPRWRSWRARRVAAFGSALAAACLCVVLVARARDTAPADPVVDVLAAARSGGARVGDATAVDWRVRRAASDALPERARAFRLGALSAQLAVAAATGDGAAVRQLAAQVGALTDGAEGGAIAGERAAALAGGAASSARASREAVARLTAELRVLAADTLAFGLGRWAAAARVALLTSDTAYFAAASPARAELDRLAGAAAARGRDDPVARGAAALQGVADAGRASAAPGVVGGAHAAAREALDRIILDLGS